MKRLLALFAMVAAGGCLTGRSSVVPGSGFAADRLPVLLVADGTALDAGSRADVAAILAKRIGRPVVVAHEAALDEPAEVARLAKIYGKLPARGWAEPRCALGRAAAHALHHDADAYYHLHLDRTDAASEASPEERGAVSGTRRVTASALRGLGLAAEGSAHVVELSGDLTVATFGQSPQMRSIPVRTSVREVDPLGKVHVDVGEVVAAATAKLQPPPYPHWSALARQQLAAGCRLTALAVYDARLRARADSRGIDAQALGRTRTRRAAPPPPVATAPSPPPVPPDPAAHERFTCRSLCEVHMVELCNNDRDLWSRHQRLWESTPCGQRRSEAFLSDCYQRQWLSGTFDEACLAPCERSADGRARLLHMLQTGGCARMTNL